MPLSLPNNPSFFWLFKAWFRDGSVIEQTPEDALPNSNQFKGVLDRLDDLVVFGLFHVNGKESVVLDLITGNFVVNDTPIAIHNQHFEPANYKLRLVYFRERREEQTQDAHGEVIGERSYINRYFIGWETEVNGKHKQVTIGVG